MEYQHHFIVYSWELFLQQFFLGSRTNMTCLFERLFFISDHEKNKIFRRNKEEREKGKNKNKKWNKEKKRNKQQVVVAALVKLVTWFLNYTSLAVKLTWHAILFCCVSLYILSRRLLKKKVTSTSKIKFESIMNDLANTLKMKVTNAFGKFSSSTFASTRVINRSLSSQDGNAKEDFD